MKPIILAAPILLFVAGSSVAEDRAPTAEERVRVEAALRADGYTDWGAIGLDDNRAWEVEDAVDAEGREWDLELEFQSLVISKKDD